MKTNVNTMKFILIGSVVSCLVTCVKSTPMLPPDGAGSIKEDTNGLIVGTGWRYYYYNNNKLQIKEAYINGKLVFSSWFRPDGTLLASQQWVDGIGVQYFLWDNGQIKTRMPMVNWKANGVATYYSSDGKINRTVEYKDGKPTGATVIYRSDGTIDDAAAGNGSETESR